MNKFKLVLALCIILFISGCTRTYDLSSFNEAKGDLDNKRYSSALVNFKKSINKNPTHTESYTGGGDVLILKEDYKNAVELLENGIQFVEKKDLLHAKIAEAYYKAKNFDKASENFKISLNFNGSSQIAAEGYLNSLAWQEKWAEIDSYFNGRNIGEEDKNLALIKTLFYINDKDKALKLLTDFEDIIEQDLIDKIREQYDRETGLDSIVFKMEFARIIINKGYPQFAGRIVNEVVADNEFYEGGHLFKGIIQLTANKLNEAKISLERAHQLNSKNFETQYYLSKLNLELNKFDDSKKYIDSAEKMKDPDMLLITNLRVDIFLRNKEYLLISPLYKTLQDIDAENKDFYITQELKWICISNGDVNYLETNLNLVEGDNNLHLGLSTCVQMMKEGVPIDLTLTTGSTTDLFTLFVRARIYKTLEKQEEFNSTKELIIDIDTDGIYTNLIGAI